MAKHPYRFLITVLLLGWIFDFLFWEQSAGVNFAIFIVICLLGGYILLSVNELKPAPKSLLLILPITFFAVITFFRQEPLTLFLAYTLTIFSMGIFTVSYQGGRWLQYSLLDLFYKFVLLMGNVLTGAAIFFSLARKEQKEQGEAKI